MSARSRIRTRILAALAVTFAVATLTAGLLGIWLEDDRWGASAFLLFFAALISLAAAGISSDTP